MPESLSVSWIISIASFSDLDKPSRKQTNKMLLHLMILLAVCSIGVSLNS